MSAYVMGMDLSLTASAACALPLDFAEHLDWKSVATIKIGEPLPRRATLRRRLERQDTILGHVSAFSERYAPQRLIIEELAYSANKSGAKENSGLAWRAYDILRHLDPELVPSTESRSLFLEFYEPRNPKPYVMHALKSLNCPFWDDNDRADAFVNANFGLAVPLIRVRPGELINPKKTKGAA